MNEAPFNMLGSTLGLALMTLGPRDVRCIAGEVIMVPVLDITALVGVLFADPFPAEAVGFAASLACTLTR